MFDDKPMNELDRLLECVTREPAYGPAFYQALLTEAVYALIPEGAVFTPTGTVKFVMWTGEDGQRVIPFFSNRGSVRRVLTEKTQALRLQGRVFLEACRGRFVVLNPNERNFCRLTPSELALLLDTGSPSAPQNYVAPEPMTLELNMPDVPPDLLHSLTLLMVQFPGVERAYLLTMHAASQHLMPVWLVAVLTTSDLVGEQVSRQLSAMLADRPPPMSVDLLMMRPGDANAVSIETSMQPFYDRSLGQRLLMRTTTSLQ